MSARPLIFFLGFLISTLSLATFREGSVYASSTELVVSGELRLSAGGVNLFSNITVEPGGKLIIPAGTTVRLLPDAKVTIQGSLEIEGSKGGSQAVFQAAGDAPWSGLTVTTSSPDDHLANLRLERFRYPLTLEGPLRMLENVELVDGLDNRILVGAPEGKYPDLQMHSITLSNHLLGKSMGREGILIRGQRGKVFGQEIHFHSPVGRPADADLGIWVEGAYLTANYGDVEFPGGCPAAFRKVEQEKYSDLGPDLTHCNSRPLPVVFVPGFGTSINLSQLANKPEAAFPQSGWRFFDQYVPGYQGFLADLQASGIPYLTAYYDWRLPPEVAAKEYLIPAIRRTEQEFSVQEVNVVAHSFGGLVTRSYIQGDDYQGDIRNLLEIGTPNRGTPKAYSVWEGAELPKEWQDLGNLLRYYQLREKGQSQIAVLREYVPSLTSLMPTYPAIFHNNSVIAPLSFATPNHFLLDLAETASRLTDRTLAVRTVTSTSEYTTSRLNVVQGEGGERWPDGALAPSQPLQKRDGDGTVPLVSAVLSGVPNFSVSGTHSLLPANASKQVVEFLYPGHSFSHKELPKAGGFLSFLFDCPIEVEISLPDGKVLSSIQGDGPGGEVASSEELLWMVVPQEVGGYQVKVTAKENTKVQAWIDQGTIYTKQLSQGEEWEWVYTESVPTASSPAVVPLESDPLPAPPATLPLPERDSLEAPLPLPLSDFHPVDLEIENRLLAAVALTLPEITEPEPTPVVTVESSMPLTHPPANFPLITKVLPVTIILVTLAAWLVWRAHRRR